MITYSFRMPGQAYERLGLLSINVASMPALADADILEFIDRAAGAAGDNPTRLSLTYYITNPPNAHQRQLMTDAMQRHGLPVPTRMCVLTQSALMRGALTAFRWMTRTDAQAFAPSEYKKALEWLGPKDAFDLSLAIAAFETCCRDLGVELPASR